MKVTLVGFGAMGRVAAAKIAAAGHDLKISDPAPGTPDAAKAIGAETTSLADAGSRGGVILLFLPGPDVIRKVIAGQNGLLAAASAPLTIVDHSTADPGTARNMAELASAKGHGWVDAPVLGRPSAVGKWTLPIGQTDGAVEGARPVLETYAANIFEVGGPGAGHTIKLLNQMMFGAINAMTAEMMAISDRLGVAPGRLFEIITASNAGTVSNLFRELGGRIAEDRYGDPTFSVRLLEKDIRLGIEMARASGIAPRLGSTVAAMNEAALESGFGDADTSIMWKALVGD